MKKARMNETEKLFYKTVFQKIKIKSEVSREVLEYWLELHLTKTY
jgi:hypothetical protein